MSAGARELSTLFILGKVIPVLLPAIFSSGIGIDFGIGVSALGCICIVGVYISVTTIIGLDVHQPVGLSRWLMVQTTAVASEANVQTTLHI